MSQAVQKTVGLVGQAADLVPNLRSRADETDKLLSLPPETVQELRDINFVGAPVQKRLGGLELELDETFHATAALATGCGSTAWVAGNCALHSFMIGYFPEAVQEECFGVRDSTPFIGTGLNMQHAQAEKVPGGYRVSGRWDFASGTMHADWHMAAALADGEPRLFLVSSNDYTIDEVWNTTGMRGTGSNDVVVEDLFVPEEFSMPLMSFFGGTAPGLAAQTSVFYRVPILSVIAGAVNGTLIGLTRHALELTRERACTVAGAMSGVLGAQKPDLQMRYAESTAELAATELLFWAMFEEMKGVGADGDPITMETRARWRRDVAYTAQSCGRILYRLYEVSGAHALPFDHPLNRTFRDVMAGTHHYGIAADAIYPAFAKVSFGMDPEYMLL